MNVIAYLRVSTDKQAEEGLGLDVQEAACRAWAKDAGHKIAAVLRDEGVPGSNGLDTREALPQALGMIKAGQAAGLVVARLDRLARDLVLQETLLAEVRRMGGEVFTTSAGEASYLADDPDDPSRKLIRQILGAVNEYERNMIALRLRSGRAAKAARNGYAYGAPPFGYRAEGGELVPDPDEQAVLARIRRLRDGGASLRVIADALNAGAVPARRGRWHSQTVARALERRRDG